MKRFRSWLDRELMWPIGNVGAAVIMLPILVLALPIAARDELLSSQAALLSYAAVAGVGGTWWLLEVIRSASRTKEDFYRKHVRPTLGKEYQDG